MAQPGESVLTRFIGEYFAFRIEYQEKTNWCWNATTVSVANYYAGVRGWTQCQLATPVLDRIFAEWHRQHPDEPTYDCCGDGGGPWECNRGHWPDEASLQVVGHAVPVPADENPNNFFRDTNTITGGEIKRFAALTKEQVRAEIDAERPIVMNIGWGGGLSGHIVNIFGYSYGQQSNELVHVLVHDPWEDTRGLDEDTAGDPILWVEWETLFGGYPGGANGTWNRTFRTRRN
jgi:peptidase C39-like protein